MVTIVTICPPPARCCRQGNPGRARTRHSRHRLAPRGRTAAARPAQITAIWALERSYLESWDSARPGAHPYREFVNRWTTDGFRSYVGDLQSSVDRQLKASIGEQAREAEDAFFWVTHYERGFWDMAMSG